MRLGDDGLGRFARVDPRAVGEAPALEKPREAGVIGSELGQLDFHVCIVGVKHGLYGGESARFPTLLYGIVVSCMMKSEQK